MIPSIEDILRMLLAEEIGTARAAQWINTHIEGAAERAGSLSLREHMAGLALQGLCANPGGPFQRDEASGWALTNCNEDNVALTAIAMADATIRQLEKAAA